MILRVELDSLEMPCNKLTGLFILSTITQILLGAIVLVLLVRVCRGAIRVWRAEKIHTRHLKDDRKAKEENYPD